MRTLCGGALLLTLLLVACSKDGQRAGGEGDDKPMVKLPPKKTVPSETAAPAPASVDPDRPRYLRANSQGTLVDALQFPSVPAFIVEQQVSTASTRSEAAGILRRFGLASLDGKSGQVWMAKASLVDRLARERVLVVSFRGEPNNEGLHVEDGWIVFLGSTEDDRVLKIGSARVTSKLPENAELEVDARELHSQAADDVVATWSSCAKPMQKSCNTMRAWTMQRGYPELILDVTGDNKPTVSGPSAPHDVVVDGKVLKFDGQTFAYR